MSQNYHQIVYLNKSSVVWSYFYALQAEKEAAEAEELKQELGLKVDDSLKAMIQQRQQSRESQMGAFFDQLEAKYAQPKKARTTSSANKETKSRKKSKKWNIVTVLFILVDTINLVMLNKLRCHTTPNFQPIRLLDPSCWYKFRYWTTNSADHNSTLFTKVGHIRVQQD